jgi:hypothetical protein
MPDYPESGDYAVGRFEVSARVTDTHDLGALVRPGMNTIGTPVVIVSSAKAARTFLTASPADARGLASALRVAADQADQDAGYELIVDSTPEWIKALAVSVYRSRTSELAALRAELAERIDYRQLIKLQADVNRLAAELDTVTAERDNALAELENAASLVRAEAKRTQGEADTNAMRKAMGWVVDVGDPLPDAMPGYFVHDTSAGTPDNRRWVPPELPSSDPAKAPTGERAEYIERLRAELGTVDAPDYDPTEGPTDFRDELPEDGGYDPDYKD